MKKVETLTVMEKALAVGKWEMFAGLALDEVAMIATRTDEVEYEAGEIIDPDSPTGSSLHLILRGSVELSIDGRPFRRADAGSGFGTMALLGEPLPGEQAEILESTHALLLSRRDFENAVTDHPELALAILRAAAVVIRRGRTPEGENRDAEERTS